jgi:divalent metal cation (Fe/Co/Zn/Cd) transporter
MGLFLITEAALKFLHAERTTIGGFEIFGEVVWAGWLMLAAVAYTGVPTFFLGRLKMKLAQPVHDKIIYADARMMHADWLTESATAIGVLGAGLGVWWIDPLAAALISLDILRDGVVNLSIAFGDLMERRPLKTDRTAPEPLPEQIRARIQSLEWVNRAEVRLRDVGHVVFGEVFVEPRGTPPDLPAKIAAAAALAKSLSWRIHDVTITVLPRLGGPESTTGIDRAKAQ